MGKAVEKYQISHDAVFHFELRISKGPDEMKEDIKAVSEANKLIGVEESMFLPNPRIDGNCYGFMFLNRWWLGVERSAAARACLHAAFAYERLIRRKKPCYEEYCDDEIDFASLFSQILERVSIVIEARNKEEEKKNKEASKEKARKIGILHNALTDVVSTVQEAMGEWLSVEPPYLPPDKAVLHDIFVVCDEALQSMEAKRNEH